MHRRQTRACPPRCAGMGHLQQERRAAHGLSLRQVDQPGKRRGGSADMCNRGKARPPSRLPALGLTRSSSASPCEQPLPLPPPLPMQDAIDRAVTAAVGEGAIDGWNITRLIPFNPVDKKTVAEVGGRGLGYRNERCGDARGAGVAVLGTQTHRSRPRATPRCPCKPWPTCAGHLPQRPAAVHLQGRAPDHP